MVGNEGGGQIVGRADDLVAALHDEYPELEKVARAAGSTPVYVVGGAIRDLLLSRPRSDLDLAVEGDPIAIAERLGGATAIHERFLTATARVGELPIDLARTRTETYPHPGALPVVQPADLASDLARRDFTVNAMALPIAEPDGATQLIDPHRGYDDLVSGTLRALHAGSFDDDPTRVLRGARYAAAYGLEPDQVTRAMVSRANMDTVSQERREAELRRITEDAAAIPALRLLCEWDVGEVSPAGLELAEKADEFVGRPPWKGEVDLATVRLAALQSIGPEVRSLAELNPDGPMQAVEAAERRRPEELLLARLLGAEWLDQYMGRWRAVELEIDGQDLIAAGVREGPAVGRGIREARRRKLEGELAGRDQELRAALAGARHDAVD